MIDPDILEAMQDRARGAARRVQATAPPPMGKEPHDHDLIQKLRERAGAAYAAGDDERASRLRRAAEILQGGAS